MRQIDTVIIHCSDTYPSMEIGAAEIRVWHLERGWNDIGYHWVIARDGEIQKGRDEDTAGAHAYGHNANSIGICLVGGKGQFNFTLEQIHSLEYLVDDICRRHNILRVIGHNEVSDKPCPQFDVQSLFQNR